MLVQLEILGTTHRAAQLHAFGLPFGQGLFGARADEIPLDLGHQAQHDGDDSRLQGVVEDDIALGDMQLDTLLDALPADLQHLQRAARQARDLRHDDHVALPCPPDHFPELTVPPIGLAADGVLDEHRFKQLLVDAITHDAVLLVGNVLGVGRDAEVGKN